MIKQRLLWVLGVILFAAACQNRGGDTNQSTLQTTPIPMPVTTEILYLSVEPIIDNVRLLVLQANPIQVDVIINGSLPNGCARLVGFTQERQGDRFLIKVQAEQEQDAVCTEALIPFTDSISLDLPDLPDGFYQVEVGDKIASFQVGETAFPTAPEEGGGGVIRGAVWHDYCDFLPDGSPSAGCVELGEGSYRADGIQDESESRLIGVEITLSPGDCPADGTPSSDLIFTTTRTDGTGSYLFSGVPAGRHCVSINAFSDINIGILPPGLWTYPRVNEAVINSTVDLTAGEVKTGVDFGWDYQLVASTVETACSNRVTFVADVTIPDNTVLAPGQEFVKTWRLRNSGDCTWTTAYALEFVEGDAMGFTGSQFLATAIGPGQEVELSVTLKAPAAPGSYRSDWQLSNERGVFFGLGANANVSFYVQIVVR
ncbi:MAG: hypothetical protein KJ063_08335 [Anaerolineae bacterium]|nr:hypothetical protein [Anaerolineae bacterium]